MWLWSASAPVPAPLPDAPDLLRARYETDLHACRAGVGSAGVLRETLDYALQGALVDDNRQPLSDSQLDHIRREFIGKPQATMASFGLAAGSPQALRLFS